jgi:hypothetical protein
MAKGRVSEIVGKGLTQESLPYRLKFVSMEKVAEKMTGQKALSSYSMHFKGFLSICALTFACFGEYDRPLEFFLIINTKTGEAKVSPKI